MIFFTVAVKEADISLSLSSTPVECMQLGISTQILRELGVTMQRQKSHTGLQTAVYESQHADTATYNTEQ